MESIQACAVPGQPLVKTPEQLRHVTAQGRELFGGIDIGRRHDLTVLWIVSAGQDGSYRTECVLLLERIVTDQGNVRLAADRSGATHGDFFCEAILALEAATGYGPNEVAMAAA